MVVVEIVEEKKDNFFSREMTVAVEEKYNILSRWMTPWKGVSRSLLGRRTSLAIDTLRNCCLNAKAAAGPMVEVRKRNHFSGNWS
jgi:hypothetical protein